MSPRPLAIFLRVAQLLAMVLAMLQDRELVKEPATALVKVQGMALVMELASMQDRARATALVKVLVKVPALVPVMALVKESAIVLDKALATEQALVLAKVLVKALLDTALDKELVKVPDSVQVMVPVKQLADMELVRNRALGTILISSTLKRNPFPSPVPQVPSPNSPNTPVGSLLDSVAHLARLASAPVTSRASERQAQASARLRPLRPVTAKMWPLMALRALTLAALVARANSSRPRVDMALLRLLPRPLPSRIPSLVQAKASHPAQLLKAMALNRASAATANLPKAAMAQQLAATDLIEDRSEFYIQNIQQDHELNLS